MTLSFFAYVFSRLTIRKGATQISAEHKAELFQTLGNYLGLGMSTLESLALEIFKKLPVLL